MKHRLIPFGALGLVYLCLDSPAYAYLDGATGSMILQAVIGGAATAMVMGRAYLAKIKNFFSRKSLGTESKTDA